MCIIIGNLSVTYEARINGQGIPGALISATASVGHVCKFFDVSRIAVMKHLNVLEEAGLLISEKKGRTRRLYFNSAPIQMIHERWTSEYSALWAGHLTEFKRQVEAKQGT